MRRLIASVLRGLTQYVHDFVRLGFHLSLIGVIIVVGLSYNRIPPEVQHFFLALVAVYLVHLFTEFVPMQRVMNLMDQGSLLKMCGLHGITGIYGSRAEVWKQLTEGGLSLLAERPENVWALGISLSAEFNLEQFLNKFATRKPENLKILLLDALTSTAVFRDCLESSGSDVLKEVANPKNNRRYFEHNVYKQFESALHLLQGANFEKFKDSVRFYRHTPLCWMIRVDDTLFFQPYTFGSSRQNDKARTIGCDMPIFRVERKQSEKIFRILIDHFNKLWSTSEGSVHATYIRNECREDILKSIFSSRGDWLRSVSYALYETEIVDGMRQDLRAEARGLGNRLCGQFEFDYEGEHIVAEIADYTQHSLALWIRDGSSPVPNEIIRVNYAPGPPRVGAANEVAQHYIQQFDGRSLQVKATYPAKKDSSDHASDQRLVLMLT